MSAWKPTDEQKYDLGSAIGRYIFQKLGVPVGSQTMPLTFRIIDSPAFQSIIRAAQAEAWEVGYGDDNDVQTPRENPYRSKS